MKKKPKTGILQRFFKIICIAALKRKTNQLEENARWLR